MKPHVPLTITSSLAIVLFSLHWADDVVRGIDQGGLAGIWGLLILAVWTYGTATLAERRSGLVVVLVASLLACGVPVLHMRSPGLAGGRLANSSGLFFWVWTLIALGATALTSSLLAVRELRRGWSR